MSHDAPSNARATISSPVSGVTPADNPFVISSNVSLTGIVSVDGDVWVQGNLEADVRCKQLRVGPTARIDGVVIADRVEVFGMMGGEIYCNHIALKPNSTVEADLNYRELELESGGYFEGRSRCYDNPLDLAPDFPK